MSVNTTEIKFTCRVHGIRKYNRVIKFPKTDRKGSIIGQWFVCRDCGRKLEMV